VLVFCSRHFPLSCTCELVHVSRWLPAAWYTCATGPSLNRKQGPPSSSTRQTSCKVRIRPHEPRHRSAEACMYQECPPRRSKSSMSGDNSRSWIFQALSRCPVQLDELSQARRRARSSSHPLHRCTEGRNPARLVQRRGNGQRKELHCNREARSAYKPMHSTMRICTTQLCAMLLFHISAISGRCRARCAIYGRERVERDRTEN
jgi:hypothetical protein